MPSPASRRILTSAVILVLPVVVLAGAWRLGGASALEDDLIYYLPIRQYIAERLRAGEFPLWNPLVAMGSPIAADPQSGLWYPPTWLFVLLPPLAAYPVSLVLHFALAGGGMYRFLRASRRDWRAALLGAIAFEFCGYLVAHRAHLTIHHATAWAPWILYGWRRYAERGRLKHAAMASAAFGLQLLVQHVQVSIVTGVLVTGYVAAVLVRWRTQGRTAYSPFRIVQGSGMIALLKFWWAYPAGMTAGAMLAGVQLVPTWMHFAQSVRGAPSYYLFTENSWLPTSALMLLFPMLFGARTPNLWGEPWWGPSHFCEQSAYASILILVLAAASLRLVRVPPDVDEGREIGAPLKRLLRFLREYAPVVIERLRRGPVLWDAGELRPEARAGFTRKLLSSASADLHAGAHRLPRGWNREVAFWWGACLVALLIALGDLTPLGRLLFHLPIYRSLRVPARWILVWSIAMPALASLVVSTLIRGRTRTGELAGAVRFTVLRVLPAGAVAGLLLLAVAAHQAERIARSFPSATTWQKIAGLMLAGRADNPAVWWPLLMMLATGWTLLRWLRTRRSWAFALMLAIFVVDIAGVASFVDVDLKTYARRDLTEAPPLACAIRALDPRPGDRLLVPRYDASYDRPIEVLWPQYNLRHGIAVFNGYGPLWPMRSRVLLRFMPWGSSEEMLALLRNDALLRALGVRFIAVRSDEERALLAAAQLPAGPPAPEQPISGAAAVVPVCYGRDLIWGPIAIPRAGLYTLSFDVRPVAGSSSRWFVRLETPQKTEIGKTRTIDPADMAVGPRRMRFLYHFDRAVPNLMIRVKSEMGQALWAGQGTFRRVSTDVPPAGHAEPGVEAAFVRRAELPGNVSLYEVTGTRPLVYWAEQTEAVPGFIAAVDRLQASILSGEADRDRTLLEQPESVSAIPALEQAELRVVRLSGHEIRITATSANGGLIVFNESNDAGWHATVNGRRVPILCVNAVCQGVRVPGGTCLVRFSYVPPGLQWGAAVSFVGLVLLLLTAFPTGRAFGKASCFLSCPAG